MIAARQDDWIAALGGLIALDTSFPPGVGYATFADALEALFAPLGFTFRRVEVPEALWRTPEAQGARVNLIGAPRERTQPTCGIYVHTDCAPPGEGWTRPPLALTREGDVLYGRGTADMKGTIVATLATLTTARDAGVALRYDPLLLFCTDEEGGLYPGVRYLAEQGLVDCDALLCLNGGATARIWAGCFGSLDVAITVEGRAVHSGDPSPLGVNAVEEALPILHALMALKATVQARTSALPPPPHLEGRPLTARLTIAAIHGGAKGSALPGACRILVNRRVMPDESMDGALTEIEAAIAEGRARSRALSVATQLVGRLEPVIDPDAGGRHWPRWQRALSWGFGWPMGGFVRHGASSSSDMGFVQRAGVQEILLGGLSRPDNRTHGPDEFTTVQDITALARAMLAFLADGPIPEGGSA
ncbi:M20 family metallopeptidase [Falsiroseomonas sp. HW251]|uniref:M20 family metallopeptidase n=1 Tax=Falsiroseomonas sp. HW251 TaxID=3390998 RepID=UPI003D31C2CF